MGKRSKKGAKAPTLDEFVAQERERRKLLESSLRNLADEVSEDLPPMEELEESDISFLADAA